MSKSNRMELDKRILIVSKLLLSGKTNRVIFRYTSLNWNITNRQTQNYIRACYALWYKEFEIKRKANLSYHLAKRSDLYSKAYKEKDWKTCLEIAKDEAKIMDIYPSERHELLIEREPDFTKLDEVLNKLSVKDLKKLANLKTGSEKEILEILEKNPDLKKLTKGGEKTDV